MFAVRLPGLYEFGRSIVNNKNHEQKALEVAMEKAERSFESVSVFARVRVKVPVKFDPQKLIHAGEIFLDGNWVNDPPHFYQAAVVGDTMVNRHYYFPTPVPKPGVKEVVAEVKVLTETLPNGRQFTRLNIYPYAGEEAPEYEIKFSVNGQAGVPIQGGQGRIIFRPLRRSAAAPPASKVQAAGAVRVRIEGKGLLSFEQTAELVDAFIRELDERSIVIPNDSNKNAHTRACWALYQLKKGEYPFRVRVPARFQESLEMHLKQFKQVA